MERATPQGVSGAERTPTRTHEDQLLSDALSEPMTMVVSEGAVVVLGPNGIAAALTPAAAEESGRRLLAAAERARSGRDDHPADRD